MTTRRPTSAYRRQPAPPGGLRLDANEGPAPDLAPGIWPLEDEVLRRYPDTAELEADLAARHGVTPDRVLVTAGGDDAIARVCHRFLSGGRELVLTSPTFEMFSRYARLAGGSVRSVAWWEGPYPVDEVVEAVGETTGCVAVVSPNNPTGSVVSEEALRRLHSACGGRPLLLDAAYEEFADRDLTSVALELPDTLVLRTLSKAWGLAGLRVGWLLGPPALLSDLRACGQPYAVSGPSIALARSALARGETAMRFGVEQTRAARKRLTGFLESAGARPLPSQGNFVLCRPPRAEFVRSGLAALGVSVRGWPGHVELDGCMRITCPVAPAEEDRLIDALATVLAPQALLLDMDGVIADEGPSYRETIRAVLADAGHAVTREDIAAAKAAGGANNDWVLTRRLLAERGTDLGLDEVTMRFQDIYLGDGAGPGLCARETLIPSRAVLETLSRCLPLAVVTGRPRADAERFLEQHGLAGLFRAIVSMEDAPAKPDPEPVRRALALLGVERAWMAGDTPDDMVAARAAGVLPLGVRPPVSDDDTGPALRDAGAAIILSGLSLLEDLLP